MELLRRMLPFLWPHRRQLGWSILCALVVAALWGLDLAAVAPMIKLLSGKSLHEQTHQEIADIDADIQRRTGFLDRADAELAALPKAAEQESDPQFIALSARRLRDQSLLQDAMRRRYWYGWMSRHVLPWVPEDKFACFSFFIALIVLATAVKGIFMFLQDVLVGNVAEMAVMGVRREMLRKALALDYQTLSAEGVGGLMSRFTFDTEQVGNGVTLLGAKLVREPLKCFACMVLGLWLNWRLTLLSLLFVPLLGYVFQRFGKLLKRASQRMMESMSRIYRILEETFDGVKVVIAFGASDRHCAKFDKEYRHYLEKSVRLVKIDAVSKPTMELLGVVTIFIALLPGAYLVLRQQESLFGIRLTSEKMELATLGALYGMLAGMLDPCRRMSTTYSRLKKSTAAMERVFAMIDAVSQVSDAPNAAPLPRHSRSIEFRDVCFSYRAKSAAEKRGAVLDHFNLTVGAGEVIAIVGHNGCGKSTLVHLLPRFFDPTSGEVYVDGQSLRAIKLADLRGQIGVVTQDTALFDDTVLENIRYGCPQATLDQVEQAARIARVLPIVKSLPQGFDSPVGEKGRALSGGQRQRIALARAILRDPSILVLDEATSAADAESEQLIYQALKEFSPGRTVLLISHTMPASLLDFVTRIVVMEEGRVLATGSHEELLKTCSVYQRLIDAAAPASESNPVAAKTPVIRQFAA